MGVATRLFTLLGGRLRLYAAFLCIAAIAFGESAIFMAAVILSDRQHAIIGVVVSSLQAAIALLLVVCTLALALLLTKPHARILLLRRRELTGARLLLPTASRPDTVNDITPLLAASRATPFDLLLDLLACVVLIGRASSARLAFGDADNTTNVVVQIVWLFFTWCFALPQFCYLCVAMDADTFGYLTAGLLRCFGCSSSKPPPSKEAYPKIARPSMPPAAELSSISESSEVEVDMSETSQGVPPPPPPASPPQLSPRASVSRADLAADLPGNITKSASGTERWLQRVASAIEQHANLQAPSIENYADSLLRGIEGQRRAVFDPSKMHGYRTPAHSGSSSKFNQEGLVSWQNAKVKLGAAMKLQHLEGTKSQPASSADIEIEEDEEAAAAVESVEKKSRRGTQKRVGVSLCSLLANASHDAAPFLRRISLISCLINAAALLAVLIIGTLLYDEALQGANASVTRLSELVGAEFAMPTAVTVIVLFCDGIQLLAELPLSLLHRGRTWQRIGCVLLDAAALVSTSLIVGSLREPTLYTGEREPILTWMVPLPAYLVCFVLAQSVRITSRLLERLRGAAVSTRRLAWEVEEEEAQQHEEEDVSINEGLPPAYNTTLPARSGTRKNLAARKSESSSGDAPRVRIVIPTSEPEAKAAPRAQYYLDDGSGGEKSVRFEGDGNSEASTSARGSLSAEAAPAPATPSRVSKRRGQKRRSTMAVDQRLTGKPINILCLDGGGVKGLNLLQMGREIERRTGKALCDTFDLVCGTSIGGAGAAAIALAQNWGDGPEKSEQLLFALIENVMKKASTCHYIKKGYRIPDSAREPFMREQMCELLGVGPEDPLPPPSPGNGTPGSAVPHVFMVAAQQSVTDGSWNPYLLTNYPRPLAAEGGRFRGPSSNDWPLRDMVMATSAAPTYFNTVFKRGHEYADGGLIHNNPSLVAISEARAIWKNRPIGTLVSLGCGRPSVQNEGTANKGIIASALYWSSHIFSMTGDTWLTHRTVKALLRTLSPETEYFRFEPFAGDVALNETRRAVLEAMLEETRDYVAHSSQRFEECAYSLLGGYASERSGRDSTGPLGAIDEDGTVPFPRAVARTFTLDELEEENQLREESLEELRRIRVSEMHHPHDHHQLDPLEQWRARNTEREVSGRISTASSAASRSGVARTHSPP